MFKSLQGLGFQEASAFSPRHVVCHFTFPVRTSWNVNHVNRASQARFDHVECFDQNRSADVTLHVVILESVNASHVVHATNNMLAGQLLRHQKERQDDPYHL